MTNAIAFQPFTSTLTVLAAFCAMIWPGYALLHVLGHGRHRWNAALFAGPSVTLALWIIALSGAAWASIPLRLVCGPVWIATLLLGALGIGLRLSVNREVAAGPAEDHWKQRLLWAAAALLPLLIMPATLWFGAGDFVNSTYPDPWSYAMVADHIFAVARGAEGGLSAIHQYASHLANTRNASSAILAHLAYGLGGVKVDQAMTPFCMLVLFANVAALIAFARTIFARTEAALCLALLAGLGWPANIVFAGNFDQLLLLPLLPLIAALALRAGRGERLWTASILIGVLGAAALFAYVELAFLGLVVAMAFVIAPETRLPVAIGRAALVCCVAIPIIAILTWPGFDALLRMLSSQYAMAGGLSRPGEGYFAGLASPSRFPEAVAALGGEFGRSHWSGVPWMIGAFLCAVTLAGAWSERRRWSVILAFAVIAAAFVHFAYREHYSYGAYKIVSINAWMLGYLTAAGGLWLSGRVTPRISKYVPVTAVMAALLLATALDRTIVQANVVKYRQNALEQKRYREALKIAEITGGAPALLTVRADLANEWAVFYLSELPLMIAPYRRYMAQAHVIPLMDRAKPVDPATIRYIITDRDEAIRASVSGARQIWDGEAYSLWEVNDRAWAVLADAINPNGIEPGGIWLGGAKSEFLVVAGQAGPATLAAAIQPGPRAAIEISRFHITISDTDGNHNAEIRPGEIRVPVALHAGKNLIGVVVNEPVSGTTPANSDTRPMILRMMNYRIERSITPAG